MGAPTYRCPVCLHSSFNCVTALWQGLMSGASRRLSCPVCNEVLLGLDKLTLHLYSHLDQPTDKTINLSQQCTYQIKTTTDDVNNYNNSIDNSPNKVNSSSEFPSLQFVSIASSTNEVVKSNICDVGQISLTDSLVEAGNVPIFHLSLEHLNDDSCVKLPDTDLETTTQSEELLITAVTSNKEIVEHDQTLSTANNVQTPLHKPQCSGEFQCGDCGAVFTTARMLSTHTQLVHVSSPQDLEHPYACHLCSRRFKMRGALMVHVRFVHGGARLGKGVRSAARTIPTNTQQQRSVASTSCSSPESLFPSLSELSDQLAASPSQHIIETAITSQVTENAHQSLLPAQPCDSLRYPNQQTIDHSLCTKNIALINSYPPEWQDKDKNVSENNQWNPAKCVNETNFCADDSTAWTKQIIQENSSQNDQVLESETSDDIDKNQKLAGVKTPSNDNKAYECEVCLKRFTTKYFHKKHQRLHTGERPYTCTTCGKTFAFQQSFHKHLLYHTSAKPHTCAECGQAFKELSTLHNHQRIHTGERPFVCETCGKAFRQRVSYLVHRRIHTGVLPYKCSACNKSFRYKVSQRTHKCQAQPPGHVIRQSELVQRLLMKAAASSPSLASNQAIEPTAVQEETTTKQLIYTDTQNRNSNFPPLLTINEESLHQLLSIFPN